MTATETDLSEANEDRAARRQLVAIAALAGVAAAVLFVGWPEFDLVVSRYFNLGPRSFVFNHSDLAAILRLGFKLITWGVSIATVAGIVLALARGKHLFGLGLKQYVFLALVLITGPGLIANTLLKDNWARPRPMHIVEFGGPDQFTPVLSPGGACDKNCSFISGEPSSIFAIGFAIAMLARRRRAVWMAGAVAAGGIIGLIRIGEGGHFLSDVIFAGTFMALDVALMHWLVFDVLSPRMNSEANWHARTVARMEGLRDELRALLAKLRKPRGRSGESDLIDPPA